MTAPALWVRPQCRFHFAGRVKTDRRPTCLPGRSSQSSQPDESLDGRGSLLHFDLVIDLVDPFQPGNRLLSNLLVKETGHIPP